METKPKSPRRAKRPAAITCELKPRRFTSVVNGDQIIYAGKGAVKITIEKEVAK